MKTSFDQINLKAFSLLELSLVMIIMSLLIVVTFSAKRLLYSAEIGNLVSSTNKLESSIGVFVSVYETFPGDMVNASSYWNDVDLHDGDGDDKIELLEYESTNALIHLHAAQMIQSQDWNYDSIYEGYEMESFEEGKAAIISKVNNEGTDRDGFDYAIDDGNYIKFGGGVNNDDMIFTPTEMYLIDSKIDNGNAKNGKMVIKLNSEEENTCSDTDGVFTTSNVNDSCMFLYKIDVLAPE